MNFKHPFFADPDYFKKEEEKFNKLFKKALIIYVIYTICFLIASVIIISSISVAIQKQGGVGKLIGNFINDIKQQIK